MGKNEKRQEQGFSLIEILVVIIVVGILLAVMVPNTMNIINTSRVKGDANMLAQTLREARERAVSRGHQVAVGFQSQGNALVSTMIYFNPNANNISSQRYNNCNLGLRPTNPPNSRPPDSLAAGAPADGIDFVNNQAVFSPQGGCTPGAIYLFSRNGRVQVAVTVNLNGRVRVWQWENGAWF